MIDIDAMIEDHQIEILRQQMVTPLLPCRLFGQIQHCQLHTAPLLLQPVSLLRQNDLVAALQTKMESSTRVGSHQRLTNSTGRAGN